MNEEVKVEEQGISIGELFQVLFGRKLLLLIVTLAIALVGTLGLHIVKKGDEEYVGVFNYYVTGLANGTYLDGSRFDVRDLITLEKLNQYKDQHEELKDLDMDEVYYKDAIKSLEYKTYYKANPAKMNDNDDEYVAYKSGYEIVLNKNFFSKEEASVLVKAIASEPNAITLEIVNKSDYSNYLDLFDNSTIYENQVEYLKGQYNLINNKLNNLLKSYGDVFLENGKRLSDIQLAIKEYFQNYDFDNLESELAFKGYVKEYGEHKLELQNRIESLNREKNVDQLKLGDLKEQRNELLAASGTLYSVELESYNTEIINLTKRIRDIDEEVALIQIKIDNEDKQQHDPTYQADMQAFNQRLSDFSVQLGEITDEYSEVEKEIVKTYSTVYFDNNSAVKVQNDTSIIKLGLISVAIGFVCALVVNLCLDGKKLIKK